MINHQDNFGTNLTSGTSASDTTSPLNSIPSVAAPFYIAFDATNINGHYEVKQITSKTATNVLHSALSYDHTTAEEVRMVVPAEELNNWDTVMTSGWYPYSAVTPTTGTLDSPSFPIVFAGVDLTSIISVGMRVKITQSTTKYFIVTAIAFSTDTTITLYGGTDYSLVASGTTAISAFSYSSMKAPVGFPLDPTKWQVRLTNNTLLGGAISASTWTNLGTTSAQLSVPIGAWDLGYKVNLLIDRSSAGTDITQKATLSTANNTESDADFTVASRYGSAVANSADILMAVSSSYKRVTLASKTLYYLNGWNNNGNNEYFDGVNGNTIIEARCAYL